MRINNSFCLSLVAAMVGTSQAFMNVRPTANTYDMNSFTRNGRNHKLELLTLELYREWLDDSSDSAERLPLSNSDYKRIEALREMRVTIPILICDAILPGQRLQFKSGDPKLRQLMSYARSSESSQEMGIIGFNPHTGNPLSIGVTVPTSENNYNDKGFSIEISAKGQRRFEVIGEPWIHESGSFFLADVEIVDHREEILTPEMEVRSNELSDSLPQLTKDWVKLVIESGKIDRQGISQQLEDMGDMPNNLRDRAMWVASLVNPIPSLDVCMEIRPAMLACKNDYERISLAAIAMKSSIDNLSGKRKPL